MSWSACRTSARRMEKQFCERKMRVTPGGPPGSAFGGGIPPDPMHTRSCRPAWRVGSDNPLQTRRPRQSRLNPRGNRMQAGASVLRPGEHSAPPMAVAVPGMLLPVLLARSEGNRRRVKERAEAPEDLSAPWRGAEFAGPISGDRGTGVRATGSHVGPRVAGISCKPAGTGSTMGFRPPIPCMSGS